MGCIGRNSVNGSPFSADFVIARFPPPLPCPEPIADISSCPSSITSVADSRPRAPSAHHPQSRASLSLCCRMKSNGCAWTCTGSPRNGISSNKNGKLFTGDVTSNSSNNSSSSSSNRRPSRPTVGRLLFRTDLPTFTCDNFVELSEHLSRLSVVFHFVLFTFPKKNQLTVSSVSHSFAPFSDQFKSFEYLINPRVQFIPPPPSSHQN